MNTGTAKNDVVWQSRSTDWLSVRPVTEAQKYLLDGEHEHEESAECWCRPYQVEQNEDVWIHNAPISGRA